MAASKTVSHATSFPSHDAPDKAATAGEASASSRRELELEHFLPYVINRLAGRISDGLSRVYAEEYGLSIAEWRVIANLAQSRPLNASAIIERTHMEKSRVSRAVRRLMARGLISGQRQIADNRAVDLTLTDSGRALYRSLVPRALDWERDMLSSLSAAEYRDLMHLLSRLDRQLSLMTVDGPPVLD